MRILKKRTNERTPEPRLVDLAGLQSYLNVGERSAQRIGRESGALRHIGQAVRYDLKIIDAWLDGAGAFTEDD